MGEHKPAESNPRHDIDMPLQDSQLLHVLHRDLEAFKVHVLPCVLQLLCQLDSSDGSYAKASRGISEVRNRQDFENLVQEELKLMPSCEVTRCSASGPDARDNTEHKTRCCIRAQRATTRQL
eukprot:790844-Amphidinium_carterae.3